MAASYRWRMVQGLLANTGKEDRMTVARVTEITSTSPNGFEDAINQGIARATKTLRGVKGAWIKDQRVEIDGNRISEYQVNMLVTFVLEDPDERA